MIQQMPTKQTTIETSRTSGGKVSALNIVRSFFGSFVFCLILSLVIVDIALVKLEPMRFIRIPGIILKQQDHIDFKVQSAIAPSNNPDILLMGSSLAESVAVNADAKLGFITSTVNSVAKSTKAVYLDNLLKEKKGLSTSTFSSAIGGTMISDHELIIQKVLKKNNKPKLVILLVEPRAFMDTNRTPDLYPVESYMKWRYKAPPKLGDVSQSLDFVLAKFWNFYNFRSDFATTLNVFADRMKNPSTKKSDAISIDFKDQPYDPDRALDPVGVENTRQYYKVAYGYVDKLKVDTQFAALSKIMEHCKKNGVAFIAVAPPIALSNLSLLPAGFEQAFKKRLEQTCLNGDAQFIDLLDDKQFVDRDFIDYVHLNSGGAIKFWNSFVERARLPNFNQEHALSSHKRKSHVNHENLMLASCNP